MWIVNIYRDDKYDLVSFTKTFQYEEDAYNFFEAEIKSEFDYEIEQGIVSDQEIQNIINNGMYRYEDEDREILISIKEVDEED